MTRVLIVEDDPMAQSLLKMLIDKHPGYALAGCLESAAFALSFCLQQQVELVLMDVCTAMCASGLIEAAKIKRRLPRVKVIIITSPPECDFISRARLGGIDSFWYKSPREETLFSVMDRTMAGEQVYPDAAPEVRVGSVSSRDFTPESWRFCGSC